MFKSQIEKGTVREDKEEWDETVNQLLDDCVISFKKCKKSHETKKQ